MDGWAEEHVGRQACERIGCSVLFPYVPFLMEQLCFRELVQD